jgi:hypothetical protein
MAEAASVAGTHNPTIFIRVYDSAEVPKGTWTWAMRRAGEIFREAGVETSWVRFIDPRTEMVQREHTVDLADAPGLKLRILPRFVAMRRGLAEDMTGYALVPAEFGRAAYAAVFYDRIVLAAQEGQWGEPEEMLGEILAHVMAHELGHLLLGTNSHSRTGIMRAQWSWEDLRPLDAVRLHFTSAQAEIICSQALARVKAGQDLH